MAKFRKKSIEPIEQPITDSESHRQAEAAHHGEVANHLSEEPDPATEFDPVELERQLQQEQQTHASRHTPTETHAAQVANSPSRSRPTTLAPDPFAIETLYLGDNVIHLSNSHRQKAYFVRFDTKPPADSTGEKHPALKELIAAGFRWQDVGDGSKAWKKRWADGQFSHVEEQEARKLTRKVAQMLGPVKEVDHIPE
ncbi:MAG: hypothetical protein K8U57_28665 [Planctomycetes bacterium]|nr:hypothetical protein [Planctomycetota bacterium]